MTREAQLVVDTTTLSIPEVVARVLTVVSPPD